MILDLNSEFEKIQEREKNKKDLKLIPEVGEVWNREKIKEIMPDIPEVRGHFILLRIFQDNEEFVRNEDGTSTLILKPDNSNEDNIYNQCVGLVVGIGDEAYSHGAKWADYGEWHIIDKYDGKMRLYDGVPFIVMPDVAVHCKVEHPEKCRKL